MVKGVGLSCVIESDQKVKSLILSLFKKGVRESGGLGVFLEINFFNNPGCFLCSFLLFFLRPRPSIFILRLRF